MYFIKLKDLYIYNKHSIWVCLFLFVLIFLTYTITNKKEFSYSYPKELVKADSLCDIDPNSARIILDRYAVTQQDKSEESEWFYRYLQTKTRVKLNESFANDSEIIKIIEHYENKDYNNILPKIYYCAGCIYNTLNDTPRAIDYFHKAINEPQSANDEKTIGLCYYQLGHLYSLQGLHNEALYWQKQSLIIHKRNKDYIRCIYDYEDLAWTLRYLGDNSTSITYLKEALKIAKTTNNYTTISEIESQIAAYYLYADSLHLAKRFIDNAIAKNNGQFISETYSIALNIYAKLGIDDEAQTYCEQIISKGNINAKQYAYLWQARHFIKNRNINQAINNIDKYIMTSDTIQAVRSAEASAKANALYNYNIHEREKTFLKKENDKKTIYIIITVSVFIIGTLILLLLYYKTKQKKEIVETRCHNLNILLKQEHEYNESEILKKEAEIKKIKKQLTDIKEKDELKRIELEKDLFSKQHDLENILYNSSHKRLCDSSFKKSQIYKELSNTKDIETKKFDLWFELEQTIYESYPNFEERIQEFEKMSDTELRVCLLIKCGFNATTIGKFLFKTQTSIYSICKRLYYKNFREKAPASKWEEIIRTIY